MGGKVTRFYFAEVSSASVCVEERDGCDYVRSCVSARAPTGDAETLAGVFGVGGRTQSSAGD